MCKPSSAASNLHKGMQVKALRLLQSADCVVYDALAPAEALHECRDDAELVFVGKRGGVPSLKQDEIDALLVRKCRQHAQACAPRQHHYLIACHRAVTSVCTCRRCRLASR